MRIYIYTYVGVCVSMCVHLDKHPLLKERKALQSTSKYVS